MKEREEEERDRGEEERCEEREGRRVSTCDTGGEPSPVHGRLSPTVPSGSQRLLPSRKRGDPFTPTLFANIP